MRGGIGRRRASAGWWKRLSRRWSGCIVLSTVSFRSPRGAGARRRSTPRPGVRAARPEKEWPVAKWVELARNLAARGYGLVLPWGTDAERRRSDDIAAAVPNAKVPDLQALDDAARMIARATFVVGVDTGLLHLAAALGVPLT